MLDLKLLWTWFSHNYLLAIFFAINWYQEEDLDSVAD